MKKIKMDSQSVDKRRQINNKNTCVQFKTSNFIDTYRITSRRHFPQSTFLVPTPKRNTCNQFLMGCSRKFLYACRHAFTSKIYILVKFFWTHTRTHTGRVSPTALAQCVLRYLFAWLYVEHLSLLHPSIPGRPLLQSPVLDTRQALVLTGWVNGWTGTQFSDSSHCIFINVLWQKQNSYNH